MRIPVSRFMGVTLLLLSITILSGCATLGQKFQEVETPSDGSSLVYIYRPKAFVGGGVSYKVWSGNKVVTTLHNGGYYPYHTEEGKVSIWAKTESKTNVDLYIKAGKTYYIKGTVGMGVLIGRPYLRLVPEAVALKEISECRLIPEQQEVSAKSSMDKEF